MPAPLSYVPDISTITIHGSYPNLEMQLVLSRCPILALRPVWTSPLYSCTVLRLTSAFIPRSCTLVACPNVICFLIKNVFLVRLDTKTVICAFLRCFINNASASIPASTQLAYWYLSRPGSRFPNVQLFASTRSASLTSRFGKITPCRGLSSQSHVARCNASTSGLHNPGWLQPTTLPSLLHLLESGEPSCRSCLHSRYLDSMQVHLCLLTSIPAFSFACHPTSVMIVMCRPCYASSGSGTVGLWWKEHSDLLRSRYMT